MSINTEPKISKSEDLERFILKEKLQRYLKKYSKLVEEVRIMHKNSKALTCGAHDFSHVLMVGQYCIRLTENEIVEELSWLAALLHNTDRLIWDNSRTKDENENIVFCKVRDLLEDCVKDLLSKIPKKLISEAVMEHSKLNSDQDSHVTMILKDADRLANLGPNMVIRNGQAYHDRQGYNLMHTRDFSPGSTYATAPTALDAIRYALEWEGMLRVPKAQSLAKPYLEILRKFIEGFSKQAEEVSLDDYPFPEDYGKLL
ncbi:MAG: HD domain-containing protein [Candidatus Paceibacterota bacterium]